jgi:hypothetical protein
VSFDLAVWYPHDRLSNEQAMDVYRRLCAGQVTELLPHPAVEDFYRALIAIHPEVDDLPEHELDDSPWSVRIEHTPAHVVMCCVWPKAASTETTVRRLAQKHGLAVVDPQRSTISYPVQAVPPIRRRKGS